nr:agmatine deiminase [Raoultella sp. NCTC 9187]
MVTLEGPSTVRRADESDDFAPGYINFYLCNGAVIAPQFGDKRTDRRSRDIPQEQFADREIIQQILTELRQGAAFTVLLAGARRPFVSGVESPDDCLLLQDTARGRYRV